MGIVGSALPHTCQELFEELEKRVVWLHADWTIYRELWGTNQERFDVMNASAKGLFIQLEGVMLHHVQLGLGRLGDPATSFGGKKSNLTLAALRDGLRTAGEIALVAKLDPLLQAFDLACAALRKRRNTTIAHSDLPTALSAKTSPLMHPSRAEVEKALEALREFMNCISLHYAQVENSFVFVWDTGADALLQTLRRGLRYADLVADGTIPRDDLAKNGRRI